MRKFIDLMENIYKMGMCDAMAIALHQKYGYPLGVWRGFFPDEYGEDGEEAYEDAHMCVILPDGKWVDVDGVHQGTPPNLIFNENIHRIELVKISEDEARYIFSMDGVTDEQIETAKLHLRSTE